MTLRIDFPDEFVSMNYLEIVHVESGTVVALACVREISCEPFTFDDFTSGMRRTVAGREYEVKLGVRSLNVVIDDAPTPFDPPRPELPTPRKEIPR